MWIIEFLSLVCLMFFMFIGVMGAIAVMGNKDVNEIISRKVGLVISIIGIGYFIMFVTAYEKELTKSDEMPIMITDNKRFLIYDDHYIVLAKEKELGYTVKKYDKKSTKLYFIKGEEDLLIEYTYKHKDKLREFIRPRGLFKDKGCVIQIVMK